MSAPTRTVDSLVGEVSFALLNLYDPKEELDKAIRFALDACMMEMVEKSNHAAFRKDGSLTTIAGQSTYLLADDYQQMLDGGVKLAASPFRTLLFRPEFLHNALERDRDQASGTPMYYWIRNKDAATGLWEMQVWPTPDSAIAISYRYRILPEAIFATAPGSTAVIDRRFPSQFIPALVSGAVSKFKKYLSAQDLATRRAEYDTAILDMKSNAIPVSGAQFRRQMDVGPAPFGRLAWRGNPLTGATE